MFLFLLVFTCSGYTHCDKNAEKDYLGCWIDSREENKPPYEGAVFRPCGYKEFPPSRFRFKFELLEDGICKILKVSPIDAHYMEEGTWKFDAPTNTLTLYNANGTLHRSYEVLKAEHDLLELRSF
ncbi:MAG: hypothetical protein AAF466_00490 [Bacteroidota bacterium]